MMQMVSIFRIKNGLYEQPPILTFSLLMCAYSMCVYNIYIYNVNSVLLLEMLSFLFDFFWLLGLERAIPSDLELLEWLETLNVDQDTIKKVC